MARARNRSTQGLLDCTSPDCIDGVLSSTAAVNIVCKLSLVIAGRVLLLILCQVLPLRMCCSATCSVRLLLRMCSLMKLRSGRTCCLAAAARCHYLWCTLILRRYLYWSICIAAPAICNVSCSGCCTRILISHSRAHADVCSRTGT